ncbi:MAG: hypothetical protein ABSE62_14725 [Chthoniobacteraceae bacterium]|jgi:hypothetical protein
MKRLIRNIPIIVAILALAALAACGGSLTTKLTQANFDQLQNGMSTAAVKSILGDPTQSDSEPIPIVGGTKTTYTYTHGQDSAVIVFKNDNMETKEGHFATQQ